MHQRMHTYTRNRHSHTHTHQTHALTHTNTHTHIHVHSHTYKPHIHSHTYKPHIHVHTLYTPTHTRIHTHIHIHTLPLSLKSAGLTWKGPLFERKHGNTAWRCVCWYMCVCISGVATTGAPGAGTPVKICGVMSLAGRA